MNYLDSQIKLELNVSMIKDIKIYHVNLCFLYKIKS